MTYHVLIVEDEPDHAALIARAFEQQKQYRVDVVHSLADARRQILASSPHLVFVDIRLPDGHGTELLGERTADVPYPIVIMTSYGDEQVAVEAMKAGALDYIVKSPSTLAELPRVAERTLREWRHIMARRHAEAEIRRTTAVLRAFIESAALGFVGLDGEGTIVLVNQQIEAQFGYKRDELIGQGLEVLIPEATRAAHDLHRQGYVEEPFIGPMAPHEEWMALRKDGSQFPVEVALSHIETDGNLRVLALVIDISARKRLEAEALEAERYQIELAKERELRQHKDRFLSLISHEFRTPLAVILSSSEMLRNYGSRLSDSRRDEIFSKIEGQVRALDEMINDILLLARSEMKRIDFNPKWMPLEDFCAGVVESVCKATRTNRVYLKAELTQKDSYLDRYLMEHVLTNLLVNAVRYSPVDTPVELLVLQEAETCTFVISDHGIGIPAEDQPRIFEPFHRAANTGDVPGSGIGLALVKDFVALQAGTVSFSSVEGEGTQFTVVIPVRQPVG